MRTASEPRAGGLTAEAALRAAAWVDGLRDGSARAWRSRPAAVCAAVCAGEIAAGLGGRPAVGLHAWAADMLGDADLRAVLDAPLAQTLTAAVACRRRQAGVPALDRVADSALELFAAEPASDNGTAEARLIAHAAGLAAGPGLPGTPAPPRLPATDADVASFAVGLSAATGFGTRRPAAGALDLADLVSGLAGHYLRAYDLPLGAVLVRALGHVGATDSVGAQRCLEFLLLQQRPEGAFGFFGPEAVDLSERAPAVDLTLDLQLPVTLACAVALAEAADPGWRFVDCLG